MRPLVGRDEELEFIATWLDASSRMPSTVLIEGTPGIGKTTVLDAAVEMAHARSHRVLRAWPSESEIGLAYAGLVDLLRSVDSGVFDALPEPQRIALEVALLRRPTVGLAPDRVAISISLVGLLELLAAQNPLLIAVDDGQWLDAASVDAVRFALRRVTGLPVTILVTRRAEVPATQGLGTELPAVRKLLLGPLSIGALHAVVRAHLGTAFNRPRLHRLHELSGGNPLYAVELARAVTLGTFSLAQGEPLPPDLNSLVGDRVVDLPPASRRLLAMAAASSRPTRALLSRTEAKVDALLGPAVEAGIIHPIGQDDEISFTHPLRASAAYGAASAAERSGIHAVLARSAHDPVERATHLAQAATPPDGAVAEVLEAAAAEAFNRGAPSIAADLAARSGTFSIELDDDGRRRRAELEAGYRFGAGDTAGAALLLDRLIGRTAPGADRARLLARRARIMHFGEDVGAGVALLERALAEAKGDAQLQGEIEEGLAWGLLLQRRDLTRAVRHAQSAVRMATAAGDDAPLAEALAVLALTRLVVGRSSDGPMRRALDLEPATRHLRVLRHPSFAHAYQLTCQDDFDPARRLLEDLRTRAHDQGDDSASATILNHLASVALFTGRLDEADQLAAEAEEFALESEQLPARAAALGRRALIQTISGVSEGARDAATQSLGLAGGPGFDPAMPSVALARGGETAIWAMGMLELTHQRWHEAIRYLSPLAETMLEAGVRNPGELRFLLDETEALLAFGDHVTAERRAGFMAEIAAASRLPSARAAADIAAALLGGAERNHGPGIRSLTAWVKRAPGLAPLLHGRILLALGQLQRRAKRRADARVSLNAARQTFVGIGAGAWSTVAGREIARISGRPASGSDLTSTELTVARLVSRGLTNREVAAALFVTPKAIEAVLGRVYAKRGFRSRTELAHAMREDDLVKE